MSVSATDLWRCISKAVRAFSKSDRGGFLDFAGENIVDSGNGDGVGSTLNLRPERLVRSHALS